MKLHYPFMFDSKRGQGNWIPMNPNMAYDMAVGYGFGVSSGLSKNEDLRTSWPGDYFQPSVPTFLVDVPYGNYKVTIQFGDDDRSSITSVIAGLGCLMLDQIRTSPGQFVRESFAVHVDDGQLKLAFSGESPGVRSVVIERDPSIRTLFLAGDSTLTDQPAGQYPYTGWGQGLARFLTDGIAVSNHARSGASSKSFIQEDRLFKIMNRLRPSDILLIQFAHNDEKNDERGTVPYTTYQQHLRQYIDAARSRGAIPVLVTPMHRRIFDEQGHIVNSHGEYIEAMKQLAVAEKVPCVDLASQSKRFFEQLGEAGTKTIFMWAEPGVYSSMPEGASDNTHFSREGGIEIARLVAEYIRDHAIEPLASYVRT
jgi:lysophospholipase L1-like esterase